MVTFFTHLNGIELYQVYFRPLFQLIRYSFSSAGPASMVSTRHVYSNGSVPATSQPALYAAICFDVVIELKKKGTLFTEGKNPTSSFKWICSEIKLQD